MRTYLEAYELKKPRDLSEALGILSAHPGQWQPLAGGTDLMVLLEAGKLQQKKLLSIHHFKRLKEWGGIESHRDFVAIGALANYSQIQADSTLQAEFPLLCQAARQTGALGIQNRGTIGGNIVNASPAADSPPGLLVYDTELELISLSGVRRVPFEGFHTGYKKIQLRPDELLQRILVRRNTSGTHQYFRKVGTRRAQAISQVSFAGLARSENGVVREIRLAMGSVAPTVLRCRRTEAVIRGQKISADLIFKARSELSAEISPIDDIRSTALFRRRVAQNLLEEFLCGIGS
ncbi:xanthine dehydrogenase family protein subunit M [Bdellovibrionota bacterium FG-1]